MGGRSIGGIRKRATFVETRHPGTFITPSYNIVVVNFFMYHRVCTAVVRA